MGVVTWSQARSGASRVEQLQRLCEHGTIRDGFGRERESWYKILCQGNTWRTCVGVSQRKDYLAQLLHGN